MAPTLVLGASGYVGQALVQELRRRGHPTVAHVRFDSPRLEHWRAQFAALGAEMVSTAWDSGQFAALLREREFARVYLCLGTTLRRRLWKSKSSVENTYEAVDFGLSALVIDACVEAGVRPRIVLLSAAGARTTARSPYLAVRGKLEAHLQASGIDFTIARPAFITGPGRAEFRPLERLGAALFDMALLWCAVLGMQIMRERYRAIGATELAKALVTHGADPHGRNRVLDGERLRDFP